jgi:hypothetical protein
MIFAKFQSLTHKIDTMVIRDIKREMPLKYWSFKVAEWIARVGIRLEQLPMFHIVGRSKAGSN